MMKLSVGDIGLMSFGIAVVLLMMLLKSGKQGAIDLAEQRESRHKFLQQLGSARSPVLVMASIVAAGVFAYIFIGIWLKVN